MYWACRVLRPIRALLNIGKPESGETVAGCGRLRSRRIRCRPDCEDQRRSRRWYRRLCRESADLSSTNLALTIALTIGIPILKEQLQKACPSGIDVYFENVGGPIFKAVLAAAESVCESTGLRGDFSL